MQCTPFRLLLRCKVLIKRMRMQCSSIYYLKPNGFVFPRIDLTRLNWINHLALLLEPNSIKKRRMSWFGVQNAIWVQFDLSGPLGQVGFGFQWEWLPLNTKLNFIRKKVTSLHKVSSRFPTPALPNWHVMSAVYIPNEMIWQSRSDSDQDALLMKNEE